jgi:hypothetical protein
MTSKAILVALMTTMVLTLTVGSAAAAPVTMTIHEKNVTSTFSDVIPCLGEEALPATITTTENGVFHITAAGLDDQGTPDPGDDVPIPPLHVTGTFTGTFVAVPDDASLPTFAGHFTQWFGENVNTKNDVATITFTVIGHGSDGSAIKFHETAHFSVTPEGATVEFDKMTCH